MNDLIDQLNETRDGLATKVEAIAKKAAEESRTALTPEEQAEWERLIGKRDEHGEVIEAGEIPTLDARIKDLQDQEARKREAAAAAVRLTAGAGARVVSEPRTYERWNRKTSYFRDLGLALIGNDRLAMERLQRHATEIQRDHGEVIFDEVGLRRYRRGRAEFDYFCEEMERRGIVVQVETRVNPNRTDGQGGYFVPPLWLIEQYVALARAGRVTADLCRGIPLPDGTDSINIPKIATGTAAAIQTADAAGVQSTDLTDAVVTGPVRTIAGQQDIALQLLEQSPVVFDEIIFADLAADYAMKLDVQALNGSGSSGQHTGIIPRVPAGNQVAFTTGSPTSILLYPKLADGLQRVATARFMPVTQWIFHPRRWYWMAAQLDSSGRPFVPPTAQGPFNAEGVLADGNPEEGPAGQILGVPVYLDPNVPLTFGGGAEDRILGVRFPDVFLFEGPIRTRALPEILSGTLQVRLQLYGYSAFIADRQVNALAYVGGTGLTTPTF